MTQQEHLQWLGAMLVQRRRQPPKTPQLAIITMEGGLIQEIKLDDGLTILVKDYDVEGLDLTRPVYKDADGQEFVLTAWGEQLDMTEVELLDALGATPVVPAS